MKITKEAKQEEVVPLVTKRQSMITGGVTVNFGRPRCLLSSCPVLMLLHERRNDRGRPLLSLFFREQSTDRFHFREHDRE